MSTNFKNRLLGRNLTRTNIFRIYPCLSKPILPSPCVFAFNHCQRKNTSNPWCKTRDCCNCSLVKEWGGGTTKATTRDRPSLLVNFGFKYPMSTKGGGGGGGELLVDKSTNGGYFLKLSRPLMWSIQSMGSTFVAGYPISGGGV